MADNNSNNSAAAPMDASSAVAAGEEAPPMAPPANGSAGSGIVAFDKVLPHLVVKAPQAGQAVEFYKRAFGAEEVGKWLHPKRKAEEDEQRILRAHLKFGGAEIIVCEEDASSETNVKAAAEVAGTTTTTMLHLLTNNVEAAFGRAIEAGAKVSEEISEQPWGQRYGKLVDPYGFVWSIATPTGSVKS